jgi:uncharacterized protein involved in exopolysaccharide biosynthesis
MASGPSIHSPAASSPTLRELAAIFFGRWRLLVWSLTFLLVAILVGIFLSPRYEAHFKVILRRGRSDPMISPQPANVGDFPRPEVTEEELNSEAELLRDEDLLKEVVQRAGLVQPGTGDRRRETEIESAARKLATRLSVETLKKSNLIQVSYRDTDADRAARVLRVLSTLYVQRHTTLHRPSGEAGFFEQQTAETARRLQQSEAALVGFTQSRGVVSADLERDMALQKVGEAEAIYRQTDQELSATVKKIAALHEQLASFPARSVTQKRWADNPMLLEKMKSRLLELLTRYEPTYRLVQEVDRQIEEARAAIASEALNPVRDETTDKDPNYEWARMELEKAEVEAKALQARAGDVRRQIAALRAQAQEMQTDSVDQHDLIRAARADEDNYLLYLRKREEARIEDALDARRILNVAIVEPPSVPALPVHSILFYFALSFGAALAFAILVTFTAEYFDPTIRRPEEARSLLEVPVLAWLPEKKADLENPAPLGQARPHVVVQ